MASSEGGATFVFLNTKSSSSSSISPSYRKSSIVHDGCCFLGFPLLDTWYIALIAFGATREGGEHSGTGATLDKGASMFFLVLFSA